MAQAQEITRIPDICNGCIEGLDLPPRTVIVGGKPLERHFFVCAFFTARRATAAPASDVTEEGTCKGKRLIPFAELVTT